MLNNLILDGLLLPFKIYFQPKRLADDIKKFAPEFTTHFSLEMETWRPTIGHYVELLVALVWVPAIGLLLSISFGAHVDWHIILLSLASAIVIGIAFSIASRARTGLIFGVAIGLTLGVTGSVANDIEARLADNITGRT